MTSRMLRAICLSLVVLLVAASNGLVPVVGGPEHSRLCWLRDNNSLS